MQFMSALFVAIYFHLPLENLVTVFSVPMIVAFYYPAEKQFFFLSVSSRPYLNHMFFAI